MICVVVNSCYQYYEKTLPNLLESLENAQVPKNCIHIVLGQCDENKDDVVEDIVYHHRKWYNIDNNAMLWMTQEQPELNCEWIIYLHDTSMVAEDFWKKCHETVEQYNDFDCIKLYKHFSMGMGFYKLSFLYSGKVVQYMKTLENFDANKLLEIKSNLSLLEDTVFQYAERNGNKVYNLPNQYKVVDDNVKMYKSHISRIVEFYEIPGIYKIKANYGKGALFIGV